MLASGDVTFETVKSYIKRPGTVTETGQRHTGERTFGGNASRRESRTETVAHRGHEDLLSVVGEVEDVSCLELLLLVDPHSQEMDLVVLLVAHGDLLRRGRDR
jgi:hypothetical protein